MKIIHALWIPDDTSGKLHFWAENTDLISYDQPASGSLHPYCLPQLEILDVFQRLTGAKEHWGFKTVSLNLPTNQWGPLPSEECFENENATKDDRLYIKEWTVRTVAMGSNLLWRYLFKITEMAQVNIKWSDSVVYWKHVLEFALELLSRECFLPGAEQKSYKSNEVLATWSPYLSYEDHRRMLFLVEAMPIALLASCDLLSLNHTPQSLLWHALKEVLDAFIRNQLNDDSPYIYRINASKKVSHLHEQWLKALFAQKKEVRGECKKIDTFVSEINTWTDLLQIDYSAFFRVCFRLVPPESDDPNEVWVLTYYLQSNHDLSVMISSKKLHQCGKDIEEDYGIDQHSIFELVEKNLNKASRYYEPLQNLLEGSSDPLIELSSAEAFKFLRETVPLLEASGFGLMLPSWWKKPLKKLGVSLRVSQVGLEGKVQKYMGIDTIVEYDWKIAVGDEILTEEEFKRLVEMKQSLVQVRGEWIVLKVEEIEKAIAFFKKRANSLHMTLREMMCLSMDEQSMDIGLPVIGIDYEKANDTLFSAVMEPESIQKLETPEGFCGVLRPYQKTGLSWLIFLQKIGLGGCLADDMGLGKTIQLIALFLKEQEMGFDICGPTLILCPMSIMSNWKNELKKFAPHLKVMIHHGVNRLDKEEFIDAVNTCHVVITTYALASPELDKLSRVKWHRIVLDEAQNIKNNHTKQTQAIKKLNTPHKIAVTGTPLENRLLELWSIMDFLNPNYLGSSKAFRQNYAIPIERFNDTNTSQRLKKMIRPLVLRRVKTDKNVIKDLPEKIETKEFCYLTKEQVALYESVVQRMLHTIDSYAGIQRRGVILSVLIQLKQICNHPVQYLKDKSSLTGRSGKLTRLYELLEEVIAEGDKALIFTQFSQMGHLLKHDLQEVLKQEVLFLHGITTKTQRDEMIEEFQSDDSKAKVFVLSLKAGGLGLNLTSANHVFHFDRWWNPAIENQATDRAFRIGQKKTVHVHKFLCQGTVEERIDDMIDRKRELTDLVVEQGENWITELSTDDLKELFQLKLEDVEV